jgi:hypothetical protein
VGGGGGAAEAEEVEDGSGLSLITYTYNTAIATVALDHASCFLTWLLMEEEMNDGINSLSGETGGGKGADLRRSADTDKGSCLSLSRAEDDSGHTFVYKEHRKMLTCTNTLV